MVAVVPPRQSPRHAAAAVRNVERARVSLNGGFSGGFSSEHAVFLERRPFRDPGWRSFLGAGSKFCPAALCGAGGAARRSEHLRDRVRTLLVREHVRVRVGMFMQKQQRHCGVI